MSWTWGSRWLQSLTAMKKPEQWLPLQDCEGYWAARPLKLVSPLQDQGEYPSEDLGCCWKSETQCDLQITAIIWVNGNLEVGILEVDREHEISLLDWPQYQRNCLHIELGEEDVPVQTW